MKTNLPIVILFIFIISFLLQSHSCTAGSPAIRISQVYGGGGNTGAIYQNDFVELFNASSSPVSVAGWSIQYAASSSSIWHATALSGVINAGSYYLIQMASEGAVGMTLPTPDATGNTNMSATDGKIALINDTTPLTSACPSDSSIIDLVGYGTTADCYEGTGATRAPSNTESVLRGSNGCLDTDNNSSDFAKGTPDPRNSSSSANLCMPTGTVDLSDPSMINIWVSQNSLYIDFTKLTVVNAVIKVLDLLGQPLNNEKFCSNSIYHKQINTGEAAYLIVKVTNEDRVITKKVMLTSR